MKRATAKPAVWPLDDVLAREGLTDATEPSGLRSLARALRLRAHGAREYAATLDEHAAALDGRASRIEHTAAVAQSFAGKVERGEVCPVTWRRVPQIGQYDRAHVVAVERGCFLVAGVDALTWQSARHYSMRHSGFVVGNYLCGQVDVAATLDAWRAFCAARKAREVTP